MRTRAADSLAIYRAKRNFRRTPEPRGSRRRKGADWPPIFVVQEHTAKRLHYDFRLEVDGVLKSWAIPKGPSLDPREKRLAMQTENHPIEYARFEGDIPAGEYGAGRMVLWDRGTYEPLPSRTGEPVTMAEAVDEGRVRVWLKGRKLSGAFALTRMGAGPRPRWLLVKMKDEAHRPVRGARARRPATPSQGASARVGRTHARRSHRRAVLG
jgi:DNA ligase D-like protein (predicted 3'-phosphoesterase)